MNRVEKMNKRREVGKVYEYKKNPYKTGTVENTHEAADRAGKNVSHKLPVAEWKSIMAKLKNELSKQEIAAKRADRKEKKPDVK